MTHRFILLQLMSDVDRSGERESDFVETSSAETLNQHELSDLIRDLNLSKESSELSATSEAFEGCVCKGPYIHSHDTRVTSPTLDRLYLQKCPGTHFTGSEWILGPVWTQRSKEESPALCHPGSNLGSSDHSQIVRTFH